MKEPVNGPAPVGPYSPGVLTPGGLLFVSGQGPLTDGRVVPGTIEEETERTLNNLMKVVEGAGGSADSIVRCGVYLSDLADVAQMNEVYERFFPKPRPARTTVGAELPGIKVEIDCVAVLPSPRSGA